MKKIFTYLFISFCTINISLAQVTQEWLQIFNGPLSSDNAFLVTDSAGNIYISCSKINPGTQTDYCIIKYSPSGIQQWVTYYNSPADSADKVTAMAIDKSGNIYVTGSSIGIGTMEDFCTIKYNSSGIQQWVQRFNGPGNNSDWPTDVKIDKKGNIYVAGDSYSLASGRGFYTIKYNTSGVQQWAQPYDIIGNEWSTALAIDTAGNVFICGSCGFNNNYYDYCTVKYNSSGVFQWARIYDSSWENTYAIGVDFNSNVYVTGGSLGQIGFDYCTIKYDKSGVQQWVKLYKDPANMSDIASTMIVDTLGNAYVSGNNVSIQGERGYATVKYNTSGVQQWVAVYNAPTFYGSGKPLASSMDKLGNIYLTGLLSSTNTINDFCTVKFNSSGILQWAQIYNGDSTSVDVATSMAIDKTGNVYVTGTSHLYNNYNRKLVTIKYSQFVGANPISSNIPDRFELSQNYPNPFNPSTKIKFEIPETPLSPPFGKGGIVSLKIFDILGREVAILINDKLTPGTHEVDWNAGDFASGVYFYSLISDGVVIDTKKLVLLK
ncbi:MAG: T9SS C-terminal target domain-containing protein [Ignavibacteriae bacterium]|nr:MAG: T9SS C-terminal target domain-containing protein [Ignavibacteriota bacterium]